MKMKRPIEFIKRNMQPLIAVIVVFLYALGSQAQCTKIGRMDGIRDDFKSDTARIKMALRKISRLNSIDPVIAVQINYLESEAETRQMLFPQKVHEKIIQSFFITKLTGQGTGLGISLSYDVIKARGDEIEVQQEKARAEFSSLIYR